MDDLWAAVGLMLALEGALYALFPAGMRRMLAELLSQPAGNIRLVGLAATIAGVGIVWLVRG